MKLRKHLGVASAVALLLIGVVFVRPAQAVVLGCGTIIETPNTTVVLTANVGPCTTTVFGILILAENVTIDLNGRSVIGDFTTGDDFANFGIVASSLGGDGRNATVKNGTVTGFNSGIYAEEVFNMRVTGVTLDRNVGPDPTGNFGEGFQSFFGGGHVLTGNRVTNNGPAAGIVIYQSSDNTVSGNQVHNNNILDTGGHHGGSAVMQDIGIWIVNLSSNPANAQNNTVTNNSVVGNGLDGIQIANFTNNNVVRGNSVAKNGFGQPNNGLRDGTGIAIFGSSNLVESNSAVGNGGNGIGILGGGAVNGKNNTIRTNQAVTNGAAPNIPGFDLFDANLSPPCDNNTWANNSEITKNQTCIN